MLLLFTEAPGTDWVVPLWQKLWIQICPHKWQALLTDAQGHWDWADDLTGRYRNLLLQRRWTEDRCASWRVYVCNGKLSEFQWIKSVFNLKSLNMRSGFNLTWNKSSFQSNIKNTDHKYFLFEWKFNLRKFQVKFKSQNSYKLKHKLCPAHFFHTAPYCNWMWCRSLSIESMCADVPWQCAAFRVTCSFLSFCMSQANPSVSEAGLSPHTSYRSDFDGHMLSLCLAGQSFEKTQWKMATMIGDAHTQTDFQKTHTNLR